MSTWRLRRDVGSGGRLVSLSAVALAIGLMQVLLIGPQGAQDGEGDNQQEPR